MMQATLDTLHTRLCQIHIVFVISHTLKVFVFVLCFLNQVFVFAIEVQY